MFEIQAVWRPFTAVRTVLCKDGHHMHAAVVAGGDEDVRQMCATVAQAAVPARVAMLAVHRRCQLLFRTRWLLPNRAHGPVYDEWQGETGSRVKLCGQPAPQCAECCARMRIRCTRPFWTGCTSADPTSDRRTLPELAREPTLYLIPECDTEENVHEVLRELCDEIFVEQWRVGSEMKRPGRKTAVSMSSAVG